MCNRIGGEAGYSRCSGHDGTDGSPGIQAYNSGNDGDDGNEDNVNADSGCYYKVIAEILLVKTVLMAYCSDLHGRSGCSRSSSK